MLKYLYRFARADKRADKVQLIGMPSQRQKKKARSMGEEFKRERRFC
jgi:hypothetical protein